MLTCGELHTEVLEFGDYVIAASEGIDGCPRFALAYLGRKRWAKPNDRFHCIDWPNSYESSPDRGYDLVTKGRLKAACKISA
jgi:hypothetical protein